MAPGPAGIGRQRCPHPLRALRRPWRRPQVASPALRLPSVSPIDSAVNLRNYPILQKPTQRVEPEENRPQYSPSALPWVPLPSPGPACSGRRPHRGAQSCNARARAHTQQPEQLQPHLPPSGGQEWRPMLTAARIQRRWQRLVARCSRVQGGRAPRECRGAARGALRRGSEGRSRRMERSPGAEAAETILGREGRTGSLEGFAALGRMQGARAQATVCGARAAAARGVQALDHEEPSSGGWGGAAVRRVHGAAVTWSPPPRSGCHPASSRGASLPAAALACNNGRWVRRFPAC